MANMRTVERTVMFTPDSTMAAEAPVEGAEAVWWLIDGVWHHKGWLMPSVIPCGDGYKYGSA